jgi:hypothetical protein
VPDTDVALALATAVHAGFQVTVTVLVYPALVEVGDERWRESHERHSRRISPLVGVVYLGLLVAGGAALLADPGPWTWAALALTAGAVLVTAAWAAPTHAALGRSASTARDRALRRSRLVRADRVRCSLAVLGAAAAVVPPLL